MVAISGHPEIEALSGRHVEAQGLPAVQKPRPGLILIQASIVKAVRYDISEDRGLITKGSVDNCKV